MKWSLTIYIRNVDYSCSSRLLSELYKLTDM